MVVAGAAACGGNGSGPPPPSSLVTKTFPSIADAYVRKTQPGANFGKTTQLRVDAAPPSRTYLKFQPFALKGPIVKATLRVYALTTSGDGFEVRRVVGTWAETTLTYRSAPLPGSVVTLSGPFARDSWQSIDVTHAVSSRTAPVALALTPLGPTQLAIASREQAKRAPQLVVKTRRPG